MVGTQDPGGKYNGTLSQILALGGFEIKEFVIEGDLAQGDKNYFKQLCIWLLLESQVTEPKDVDLT